MANETLIDKYWGLNPDQTVFFIIMAVVIICLIIFIVYLLKRQDKKEASKKVEDDPGMLPPLPKAPEMPADLKEELETPPRIDFRKMIDGEIKHAVKRKAEIEAEVKAMQAEYTAIKGDIVKLEIIKKGLI